MPILSGNIRRIIAGFLGLALLAALWTTSLARISEKPTAVSLLTDAGTRLINPLLVSNGSGISLGTYQQLERAAAAHPNQPVQILFVKPAILGKEIAGKSYSQALQVIYGKVADAYYIGGPGAAFSLPPQLQQLQSLLGTYTPFVQSKNPLPGLPKSPLPQLPSFVGPLLTHLGFSPATLTADGHSAVVTLSLWFWIASGVLAALLAVLGAGWARLRTIAWSVFHSAWHITLLLMIAAYLVSRNPTQAAPYRDVLGLVGGAFFPVYAAATVAGLAGIVLCFVVTHLPGRQAGAARVPAMVGARVPAAPHPYTPPPPGMEPGGYVPHPSSYPPEAQYPPQPYPQPSYPQQPASYPSPQPSYPPQSPTSYPPQPSFPQQPYPPTSQPYPASQSPTSYPPHQSPAFPDSASEPARPQQPVSPEASPFPPDEETSSPPSPRTWGEE